MLSDPELLIISEILIKILQSDIKKKTKNVKQEMHEMVKKEYEKLKDGAEIKNEFMEFKELVKRKRGRPRRQPIESNHC